MEKNITFTIIKPDAVERGLEGKILNQILEAGFNIKEFKLIKLTKQQAENFYSEHKDKIFFNELVSYMTSNKIYVAILEKENAVSEYRKLIGVTDPSMAEKGTVRANYGIDKQKNSVHGSDSDASAIRESLFFFSL